MSHTCHWPGCKIEVPPAMWGCKRHWFSLPKHLRDGIWAAYRRGQEVTKSPSPAYLEAAEAVQTWIREYKISMGAWGRRRAEHERAGPAALEVGKAMKILRAIGVTAIQLGALLSLMWLMNALVDAAGHWLRVVIVLAAVAFFVKLNIKK